MRRSMRASVLALFAGLSLVFGIMPAGAAPPVEAFGNLPMLAQPALAPDGKHFALVQSVQGRPIVTIYQVGAPAGTKPIFVAAGDGRIATMQWVNNNRLIIILKTNMRVSGDNQMRTWWRSVSVDAQGKNAVILMNDVPAMKFNLGSVSIADVALNDPDHVYMPLWSIAENSGHAMGVGSRESIGNVSFVLNIYKVDVNTGRSQVAYTGIKFTNDWIMDGAGHVVARVDSYRGQLTDHVKIPVGGDWKDVGVFDQVNADTGVAGVSADGHGLALYTATPTHTVALSRLDLGTLAVTPLFANATYDVDSVIRDEWTRRVIGIAYITDKMEFVYFDPARQKLQRALERAFPGHVVVISTCDLGMHACIVATDSPREPASFYYFDVATMHAFAIGTAYPNLAPADLADMRSHDYVARDGVRIPAFLTLPPGREAKDLPLVVMPHGGPEARDSQSFDWWAQFMVSRGYAVLQPNFRGSTGYGRDFTAAGRHQWGLKMQDDLADGVAKLVAEGIADPKRVCIVGASYGGYAALAGAAFGGGTYACAVSYAGIGDLEDILRREEIATGRDSALVAFMKSRIGDRHSDTDETRIKATSPILHVDQIAIPVLLLHATGDTTVPVSQSRDMRDALTRAHKPVQYVEFTGDDHYLDIAETRIRVLSEIEKFLAANIGR